MGDFGSLTVGDGSTSILLSESSGTVVEGVKEALFLLLLLLLFLWEFPPFLYISEGFEKKGELEGIKR